MMIGGIALLCGYGAESNSLKEGGLSAKGWS